MAPQINKSSDPLVLTSDIVSAFVAHNSLPLGELAGLIHSVHAALLKNANGAAAPEAPEAPPQSPAVAIRKSITQDYLICLDDGLKFKSMRRHLTLLGMTPEQYREKWKLPPDYPMVAPKYAATRSALAKQLGLGRSGRAEGAPKSEVAVKAKRSRGRPRKAAT